MPGGGGVLSEALIVATDYKKELQNHLRPFSASIFFIR
jgi:hypothetical protein